MRLVQSGPVPARIMLVGEAPGETEDQTGLPFRGASGMELDRMLVEAGIDRRSCFLTNVCHTRPPRNDITEFILGIREGKSRGVRPHHGVYPAEPLQLGLHQLERDLERVRPSIVIALGGTAMWALSGHSGITNWRGSVLDCGALGAVATPVLPTFHPADILRQWPHRTVAVHDLRRAARVAQDPSALRPPPWQFITRPTMDTVRDYAAAHHGRLLAYDIETRGGQIACVGFASSPTNAICIPFQCTERVEGYWTHAEEVEVVALVRQLLTTNDIVAHCGSVGLFDHQYTARQWGFLPRIRHDTMIAMHTLFPGFFGGKIDPVTGRVSKKGSSLSLSFVASLFCAHYRYWKEDGRLWDPLVHPEDQYWSYNCEDCCRTWESLQGLLTALDQSNLRDQYEFEMSLVPQVLEMSFRGLAFDRVERDRFLVQVRGDMHRIQEWLDTAAGHPFNPRSNPQMKSFFYDDLGIPPQLHRKTKKPTLEDDTLETIKRRHPLLRPFIEKIQDFRTLGIFASTFLEMPLSPDGRARTAINIAGVETFRFSTNQTPFEEGTNLQNLPRMPEE